MNQTDISTEKKLSIFAKIVNPMSLWDADIDNDQNEHLHQKLKDVLTAEFWCIHV